MSCEDYEPMSERRNGDALQVTKLAPRAPGAPEYIRAETVCAEIVEIDIKTLYRWAKTDPTMPAAYITHDGKRRGTLLFHRERLMKWLRDREQGRRS